MTNKPTYMKRIIIGSSLLFSVLLAAPQAYAQESVDVIIRENGTERREVIDLPKSMTYPVDSLLNDWKAKNYIDLGKDCSTSTVNPEFSDSVYIDRLSRMPTVMEMPYNEIVRKFIDMYAGRLRNQVAFMLSACNFYMPILKKRSIHTVCRWSSSICRLSSRLSTLRPYPVQEPPAYGSSC